MASSLKKILYVEDDESIAELATMALEEFGGFEVRHCSLGSAAIAAFPDFTPDLLLLDVMMPSMDGPETLANIRKLPEGENVPAVFMTAKVQAHEQDAYKEIGALGVIPKPFDPVTISDTLQELWDASPANA